VGHPDRKKSRQRKKLKQKEEGLNKKNELNVLDLTPYNAVQLIITGKTFIKYK